MADFKVDIIIDPSKATSGGAAAKLALDGVTKAETDVAKAGDAAAAGLAKVGAAAAATGKQAQAGSGGLTSMLKYTGELKSAAPVAAQAFSQLTMQLGGTDSTLGKVSQTMMAFAQGPLTGTIALLGNFGDGIKITNDQLLRLGGETVPEAAGALAKMFGGEFDYAEELFKMAGGTEAFNKALEDTDRLTSGGLPSSQAENDLLDAKTRLYTDHIDTVKKLEDELAGLDEIRTSANRNHDDPLKSWADSSIKATQDALDKANGKTAPAKKTGGGSHFARRPDIDPLIQFDEAAGGQGTNAAVWNSEHGGGEVGAGSVTRSTALVSDAQGLREALAGVNAELTVTAESVDAVTAATDPLKDSFLSAAAAATDVAGAMSTMWGDVFSGFEDMIEGGETSFASFTKNILRDIEKILVKKALLGALTGGAEIGGKAPLGGLLGALGFATGGSFTVGGSGGTDTTPIGFMATPGERVIVQTPAQQQAAGAAPVVNVSPQIVNQWSTSAMTGVLGSPAGQKQVLNNVARDSAAFRRVIR